MGKKFAIFLIVCAVGAGVGMWGWSILKKEVQPVAEIIDQLPADVRVDVSAKGVTLSQGEDGKQLWTLTAKSAGYDQENGSATLVEPVIEYNAEEHPLRITAPNGTVSQSKNTMSLDSGVVAHYGDVKITGQRLDYNGKVHEIVISGDAHVRRQGVTINAPKFVFNLNTGDIVALDGVRLDAHDGLNSGAGEETK